MPDVFWVVRLQSALQNPCSVVGGHSRYDATTLILNPFQPGVDRREQLNQLVAARVGRHRLGGLQLLLELVDARDRSVGPRDRSVGLCGGNPELRAVLPMLTVFALAT